jgi:phage gp37-like protein
MQSRLATFEDAIIDLLQPLKSSLGVKTIESYQGDLEADDFSRIIAKFPAVYVYYPGEKYTTSGSRISRDMEWSLFICDRSFRGDKTARRGSVKSVGTYAMIEAVGELLWKKVPLPGYSAIMPVSTESVAYSSAVGVSVYECVFRCRS